MPAFQIFARYSFLKQKPYVRRSAKYLSMMAEVSSCNLDNYFTNNMIKLMFDFFVEILSFEIEYNKHEEKSNTNSWYNWKILFRQKPQKRSELVSEWVNLKRSCFQNESIDSSAFPGPRPRKGERELYFEYAVCGGSAGPRRLDIFFPLIFSQRMSLKLF